MTDIDTSVVGDISLFFRLEMEMNEDKECESPGHEYQPEFHGGKAEWRSHIACPHCGRNEVRLLCDKAKSYMESGGMIKCLTCKQRVPGGIWLLNAERL